MTDTRLSPEEIDESFAAEYVLGVLSGAERAEAAARARREPEFAALISAWEFRLGGLNVDFAEMPAPNLMPAIEARLFPSAARAQSRQANRGGIFGWLSGAMVAASLVVVVVAFVIPLRMQPVATLASESGALGYDVSQFGDHMRVTRIAGQPAAEGLVHQLWLIAPNAAPGAAPVSLGLLEEASLIINQAAPAAGWTLAVSVEPAGGSKTGQPTGPVILLAEIGKGA